MTSPIRAEAGAPAAISISTVQAVAVEVAPDIPPSEPRSMALMVSAEEAEVLMTVLLLAPMEGGASGGAMDRVLSRLADVQRAFAREENA